MSQTKYATGVAPATPEPNYVTLYAKSDKKLYFKDDAGLETGIAGAPFVSSGAGTYTVPAPVAVGDVVQVTGANTADAADSGTSPTGLGVIGIVLAKPTAVTATILFSGEAPVFVGLTPAAAYFLGAAGAISLLPTLGPSLSVNQRIGYAKNATTLVVCLGEPIIN